MSNAYAGASVSNAGWCSAGSWGATLALAYAERHTDRVTEMVVSSVATTTLWDIDWITRGVGAFFPERGFAFATTCRASDSVTLATAYHRLLMHPDPAVLIRQPATDAIGNWQSSA